MIIGISGKIGSGKDTVGKITQYLIYYKRITSDKRSSAYYPTDVFLDELNAKPDLDLTNESGWQIKKFAGKVKEICSILTGIPVADFEKQEVKDRVLDEEWDYWRIGDERAFYNSKRYTDGNEALKDCAFLNHQIQTANYQPKRFQFTVRQLLQQVGTDAMRNVIHPNCWINSLFSTYGDVEIWKDIPNYEGRFQASTFGNIRSLDRNVTPGGNQNSRYRFGVNLIPTLSNGYQTVSLEQVTRTVHTLVAETFHTKPVASYVVNHKDTIKTNNFYKNLEWVSQQTNIAKAHEYGLGAIGSKQHCAKLKDEDIIEIRRLLKAKYPQNRIAKMFNVGNTTINDIALGRKWEHVGKVFILPQPIVPIISNWIITDTRFSNEADAIKSRGGLLIRVNSDIPCPHCDERENIHANVDYSSKVYKVDDWLCNECGTTFERSTHESETALDSYTGFDEVIDNNGTIEELIEKVKLILIKHKII